MNKLPLALVMAMLGFAVQAADTHPVKASKYAGQEKRAIKSLSPGDIAELCDIAHPTHGMITNIAPAHLEGFGTIETVAETKGALFQSLKDGLSFLNAADHHIIELDVPGESVSFGLTPDCDYPADIHHEEGGTIILTIDAEEVTTYSTNLSFAKNVIACSAIARELGIKWQNIKDRIASFQPPKGRCEVKTMDRLQL